MFPAACFYDTLRSLYFEQTDSSPLDIPHDTLMSSQRYRVTTTRDKETAITAF